MKGPRSLKTFGLLSKEVAHAMVDLAVQALSHPGHQEEGPNVSMKICNKEHQMTEGQHEKSVALDFSQQRSKQ